MHETHWRILQCRARPTPILNLSLFERQGCQVGLFEAKFDNLAFLKMFGLGIFENLLSSWPFFSSLRLLSVWPFFQKFI